VNFYGHALDWPIGQNETKHLAASRRSKSEPRNILDELHDENMLTEQKRQMVKKILRFQRQKFKDNQGRKSRKSNTFENSVYSFGQTTKNDDGQALLNE
jgi:hypothetical protein